MVYRDFSQFLAGYFPQKMKKLTVNAGCTCPNRDGTKGRGGCTYCNNQSFNPAYCTPKTGIAAQLERGKRFFARKYPKMRYLAYFQAYTNTYGDMERLLEMYSEALSVENVDGIIIGTRPDCMPLQMLEALADLHRKHWVMVEYGAESSHDETLKLINRRHSWKDTEDAVFRTARAGIPVGVHLIAGLPGETQEMIIRTVERLSQLPVSVLKLHQLQLIKGTRMARDVEEGLYPLRFCTVEEYMELCCEIVRHLSPEIAVERFISQSPESLLIAPRWGLKNYEFVNLLNLKMRQSGIRQGEKAPGRALTAVRS